MSRAPLVLIVDDAPDNREAYVEYLRFRGFRDSWRPRMGRRPSPLPVPIGRRHPAGFALPDIDGLDVSRYVRGSDALQGSQDDRGVCLRLPGGRCRGAREWLPRVSAEALSARRAGRRNRTSARHASDGHRTAFAKLTGRSSGPWAYLIAAAVCGVTWMSLTWPGLPITPLSCPFTFHSSAPASPIRSVRSLVAVSVCGVPG